MWGAHCRGFIVVYILPWESNELTMRGQIIQILGSIPSPLLLLRGSRSPRNIRVFFFRHLSVPAVASLARSPAFVASRGEAQVCFGAPGSETQDEEPRRRAPRGAHGGRWTGR